MKKDAQTLSFVVIMVLFCFLISSCDNQSNQDDVFDQAMPNKVNQGIAEESESNQKSQEEMNVHEQTSQNNNGKYQKATFAGGCFWCVESTFEKTFKDREGVLDVVSGFTGGTVENPTYKEVSTDTTGHVEAIEITYDPSLVTYEELLDVFWREINPTDDGGQFVDRGFQYTTAIFYHDDEQKRLAEKSKEQLDASGRYDKPIVTRIVPAGAFYAAEDYHQDYYAKNPIRYNFYRSRSGRDQYLEQIWGEKEH